MQNKKAIIIGSGVAGMAAAIRLSVQGFQVSVYEKNNQPGGKISWFQQDGYSFDRGPSLFTQPSNIEELFALAEEPISDYFSYKPVNIACKYFYENGKIANAYVNKELFAEELAKSVGENSVAVKNYLQKAEKLYKNIGTIFLDHSLHKKNTWFNKRVIKALSVLKINYLLQTLNKYNQQKFSTPETVQLFNRFATYNGSNPFKAPAMLSLIPHLEQNEGVYYPNGGMISITNALYKLALKKGVGFHFNSAVQKIIQNDSKVYGVVVNDKNVEADIVISNVDIYFTYKNLLGNANRAQKILKQERSSSALIFYWGVKKKFPQLNLHNIFFSANYSDEFNHIFDQHSISNDPTVYVNITSKIESSHATVDGENWFVMVNVPANTGQNWDELKIQVRANVIKKINRILKEDIESIITIESTLDPIMIEDETASFMGSLYGTSSNSRMAAFLRQPNFTSNIKGLYFCGGTVHPGGGIPLCLKSAKIVCGLIKQDNY